MIDCKRLSGHAISPDGWGKTAHDYAKQAGNASARAAKANPDQERRFKARAAADRAAMRRLMR